MVLLKNADPTSLLVTTENVYLDIYSVQEKQNVQMDQMKNFVVSVYFFLYNMINIPPPLEI